MITGLGYEVEQVASPTTKKKQRGAPVKAPSADKAPKFFADAFERARAAKRLIIIDFWAVWCAPCERLKQATLANPKVAKALEGIEVIYVDVDENPALAATYGVKSIPDVIFIDGEGYMVDRLQAFEETELFLTRLEKFRKVKSPPKPLPE